MTGRPRQRYEEGLFIGHRHYERAGLAPRFWLGHGLSYGASEWGQPSASTTSTPVQSLAAQPIRVEVPVTSISDRTATAVVQGYIAPIAAPVERPARELKAWAKVEVPTGESVTASFELGPDAFHHWDEATGAWAIATGEYDLVIARSASPHDEHGRIRITLT